MEKGFIISLNPDKNVVRDITLKLKLNEGYCPCALDKNPDTKCQCKDFREMDEEGYCHCQLFFKKLLTK